MRGRVPHAYSKKKTMKCAQLVESPVSRKQKTTSEQTWHEQSKETERAEIEIVK